MFGNYGNPYAGFLQNINVPQTPVQQMPETVMRVNGEAGARMCQMPPNSSKLMLDENEPIVWLAQTDGAGYKTVTPYRIVPIEQEPTPGYKSLEDRVKRLEEMYESNIRVSEQAFE